MRKLFYATVLIASLTFSGCSLNKMIKGAEDQQLTVTPNPLEVHADTVSFEISAVLPTKMLQKGKVYTINTFYVYGDQELALEGIEFNADEFPNSGESQPRLTQNYSFAYEPAMKDGDLEIQGVALDPANGKTKETDRMKVADGVITTSKMVQKVYFPAYADHGYNNQPEIEPVNVNFYFEQGRSNLRRSERRSDRGEKFEAFIAEKNLTRTVTITGTHSPEGPERINDNLAHERAQVIEDYYKQQMSRYDYKGLADSINFIRKPVVEDWTDFKAALADYDGISSEEKSAYLDIVNGPGEFEEQEDKLHELPTYDQVFRDIYPGLRTAKTEILKVEEKKSDAEISVLAKQIANGEASADTLSMEELLYGASLTPSLEEKEAIYKAAVEKEDTWNAHNNLGAVYIAMAIENPDQANQYAEQAITQLEISLNRKENGPAYINLGSAHLFQDNTGAALDALRSASTMSTSGDNTRGANSVLGVLEIMHANYGRANNALSSTSEDATNLFNKGLAQVLNKDYQNALTSFNQALEIDSDFALANYGAAIANARLNNADKVVENVSAAVTKDPSLKEQALNDLEFRNFDISSALN